MTEVLLLALALALTLACGLFVAAEFSLTTVERGELERAAEAKERGAESALKAVRRLTLQLSGAQLGITVTSLVIGMLAEPSLAALLRGPLEAVGLGAAASSTATVLGVAISTVVLMVVGELVPKNWAISRPVAVAKAVAGPQHGFTAAFGPFIQHLNSTANRVVRRFGLEPAEELLSVRTPAELASLARHSAAEGGIEADSAELFVRTLHLSELTAQNVMTPRIDVHALEVHATAADAANLTYATGLSRFPVYHGSLDAVIGTVHIRDVLALDPGKRPSRRSPSWRPRRCGSPIPCPPTASWSGCASSARWRWSSTSTAARPVSRRWRTSSRKSSARSVTSTTPRSPLGCSLPRPHRTAAPAGKPKAAYGSTNSPASA